MDLIKAFLRYFDRHFWIFLFLSVMLGLYKPHLFLPYEGMVIYIIMVIMGLLFLKVDIIEIVTHLKKPVMLLYFSFVNLIVSPVCIYFIFNKIAPDMVIGLTLLAALPAGVTSAAFTDIMKGRTCLSVTAVILSNLLCVFTIPFVFWFLFKTDLSIDYMGLFFNLLKVFLIPFFIAKVIKRVIFVNLSESLRDYYNILIISLLSFMIMISISFESEIIMSNPFSLLRPLGILFLVFIVLQIIGYFSAFWLNKGEKIALSNSNMIMNNILGIVLALAFFPGTEIISIVVLSLIPWNIMIILKHWYKRFLP